MEGIPAGNSRKGDDVIPNPEFVFGSRVMKKAMTSMFFVSPAREDPIQKSKHKESFPVETVRNSTFAIQSLRRFYSSACLRFFLGFSPDPTQKFHTREQLRNYAGKSMNSGPMGIAMNL